MTRVNELRPHFYRANGVWYATYPTRCTDWRWIQAAWKYVTALNEVAAGRRNQV